jgi:hypothetical protein
LSEGTADRVDALAHSLGAKMFMRQLRGELRKHAIAAAKLEEKSRSPRTPIAEMKKHAAVLSGQTLRRFGYELKDHAGSVFMLSLRNVFAALDLPTNNLRNSARVALDELNVKPIRGKPRGRQGSRRR